jgi:hypothetical protein
VDFLARVTIYISLTMGICIFTMFTLFAVPNLIDRYEDIWEDYQRSLIPEEIEVVDYRYYLDHDDVKENYNLCEKFTGDFEIQNSTHIFTSHTCQWELRLVILDWNDLD